MALTPWRALKSTGEIADLPGAGFRYKYIQDITIYLSDTAGAGAALAWSALGLGVPTPGLHTKRIAGEWKVHIEAPGGATIFEQRVKLEYWFVALLMSMFGGVAFSVWTWWLGKETITTTVCGHALGEGEKPATFGVEEGYADPAGGSDYGTDYAIIATEWVSPIYLLNLPAGSTFHVDFHNVGLSKLRFLRSAIQTQIMPSAGAFVRVPGMGMLFGARGGSRGMACTAWHAPRGAPPRLAYQTGAWDSEVGSSSGRAAWVPYAGGGRLALLWEGFGGLLYAETDNMADDDGWEGPVTVLNGHTLLAADRDRDGTLYILARDSNGQVVGYRGHRASDRTLLRLSEPVPCLLSTGEALSLTSVDWFEVDGGVCYLIVDRGSTLDYYEGTNAMALWRQGGS
ncbi:MAG: hypothetical protein AB7Y46_08675 [Armatimonadota bacterium]